MCYVSISFIFQFSELLCFHPYLDNQLNLITISMNVPKPSMLHFDIVLHSNFLRDDYNTWNVSDRIPILSQHSSLAKYQQKNSCLTQMEVRTFLSSCILRMGVPIGLVAYATLDGFALARSQ